MVTNSQQIHLIICLPDSKMLITKECPCYSKGNLIPKFEISLLHKIYNRNGSLEDWVHAALWNSFGISDSNINKIGFSNISATFISDEEEFAKYPPYTKDIIKVILVVFHRPQIIRYATSRFREVLTRPMDEIMQLMLYDKDAHDIFGDFSKKIFPVLTQKISCIPH